jgi:hypothetical protein
MSMNRLVLAVVTLAVTPIAAFAADLNGPQSIKDTPVYRRAAGPCYFRSDVDYSWSSDPQTTFTQTDLAGVSILRASSLRPASAAASTMAGSPARALAAVRGRAASVAK